MGESQRLYSSYPLESLSPGARVICVKGEWGRAGVKRTFQMLVALGVTALTAAAFLRWFS